MTRGSTVMETRIGGITWCGLAENYKVLYIPFEHEKSSLLISSEHVWQLSMRFKKFV